MRVNFNCFGLGLNGGSRVIFELANRLYDRGFKVTITCIGPVTFPNYYSKPVNVDVVEVCPSVIMRAFRKWVLRRKGWDYDAEKLFLKNIPDCDVNVATACMTAYPTYFSGVGKMVYLVQNYEPWFFNEPYLQKKAKFTYSLPMKKLCVSRWLTEKVNGIYIGNGLDLNQFKFDAQIKRDKTVMGFPRKDCLWKNGHTLEKVFTELRKKGYQTLTAVAVSDFELVRLYNKASVFVSLARFEGFGLYGLEAMACGAAVVTSPCLEYAEHLENAFVLPEGYKVSDVVRAVEKVSCDSNLWQKLRDSGLETAKLFTMGKMVDNFIKEIT
jgi:hypothetical protein